MGAVAALMAAAFVRPAAVPPLVTLSVVALVLDAVDGWVARRTGTASPLGARFDGEVDALLILVLSVYVSNLIGPWVLAIGAARYLFLVAGWLLPWMRAAAAAALLAENRGGDPRHHAHGRGGGCVAATCHRGRAGRCARPADGIVRPGRVVAAARERAQRGSGGPSFDCAFCFAVVVFRIASLGLRESGVDRVSFFPRTAWPLSRLRPSPDEANPDVNPDVEPAAPSRLRRLRVVASRIATVLAFVLLWTVLVSPNEPRYVTPGTFLRIPLELLVIVAVGLLLPPRWRRILAGVVGAVFAVLAIVKLLNLGFFYELDRPFNPIGDWASFGPAAGVLRDSAGEFWTVVADGRCDTPGPVLTRLRDDVGHPRDDAHRAASHYVGPCCRRARHRVGAVRGVRRPGRRRSKCRVGDNRQAG